jgi:hypothetical protein
MTDFIARYDTTRAEELAKLAAAERSVGDLLSYMGGELQRQHTMPTAAQFNDAREETAVKATQLQQGESTVARLETGGGMGVFFTERLLFAFILCGYLVSFMQFRNTKAPVMLYYYYYFIFYLLFYCLLKMMSAFKYAPPFVSPQPECPWTNN